MEYNGLVLLDYMRQSPLCRYDYALCHACGVVYATKRPEGEELEFLYSRFDEFLGRTQHRSATLSAEEEADIRRRARGGWLVSEEHEPPPTEWLHEVIGKRMSGSYHVNLIAALTSLKDARVLELRSTTGFMLDICRKFLGAAETYAMPMSARDLTIIQALNPMPAALIDFEELDIPFAGQFDLILARHMFTHMAMPDRLWHLFGERLSPGGRVYMYLENDDAVMFRRRKNLIGEMKCFHFQNFDLPALARALRYRGLEPEFIRHPSKNSEIVCMARRDPTASATPMAPQELENRLSMYDSWRTLSVLASPPEVQSLYDGQMDGMIARAASAGYLRPDKSGKLVPHVKFKTMHVEGYEALNEEARTEYAGENVSRARSA
jgi:SAM-dependent methyltransferase